MLRTIDFLISTIALVVLSPVFLVTALVLRLTGENQVFYLQERAGRNGDSFHVFKFATMLKDSPNLEGGFLTQKNDPRVLPVGGFLRKWKINELPQLANVWLGQMSLVGPRPQARVHFDLYSDEQKAAITKMLPGITGIGSLIFRDEEALLERSGFDFDYFHDKIVTPYKGDLESWYAEDHTIVNYFKILMLTALSLVRPKHDFLQYFRGAPPPPPELRPVLDHKVAKRQCSGSAPYHASGLTER